MKEQHLFFAPDIADTHELPEEEATHALRVLRMKEGEALRVTDGRGNIYTTTIVTASGGKRPQCVCRLDQTEVWQCPWSSTIHLAVAPTKNMDRMEWLAEKATEIGWDVLHWVESANSERRTVKTERIKKIVISAMKQSHKARLPEVREMIKLQPFLEQPFEGDKFIAHCYAAADVGETSEKPFLLDVLSADRPTLVLIGPEGDFSVEEVRQAEAAGFRSVSLGKSRLRTETAALVAVQLMNLQKSRS